MRSIRRSMWFALPCLSARSVMARDEEKKDGNLSLTTNDEEHLECSIWLAPSTIPGDSGLGLFAGRDFRRGDVLAEDIIVPLVDMNIYNSHRRLPPKHLWELYYWDDMGVGTANEAYYEGMGLVSGIGAVSNSFLGIRNVEDHFPRWQDSAGLHRSKDPGVGAFSEYGGRYSTARSDISAGKELFSDYGEEYFLQRPHFGPVPLYHDLRNASHLFQQFSSLKGKVLEEHPQGEAIMIDLWDTFVRNQTEYPMSRIFGAFNHDDPDELAELEKIQGNVATLREMQTSRSIEWLRDHGTCGDHIDMGETSGLPQAGRGAFATRDLPEGTIVAQLPLIHIPDRTIFDAYPVKINKAGFAWANRTRKMPPQLLVNYCFGHEASTMLLCPYGTSLCATLLEVLYTDPLLCLSYPRCFQA